MKCNNFHLMMMILCNSKPGVPQYLNNRARLDCRPFAEFGTNGWQNIIKRSDSEDKARENGKYNGESSKMAFEQKLYVLVAKLRCNKEQSGFQKTHRGCCWNSIEVFELNLVNAWC